MCSGWDWNTTSLCHLGPIFLISDPPVYINSDGRRRDGGATEGERGHVTTFQGPSEGSSWNSDALLWSFPLRLWLRGGPAQTGLSLLWISRGSIPFPCYWSLKSDAPTPGEGKMRRALPNTGRTHGPATSRGAPPLPLTNWRLELSPHTA